MKATLYRNIVILVYVLLLPLVGFAQRAGDLDITFNPGTGVNGWISTIAMQADGKIITGGDFTSFNGTPINQIARLNADGSLNNSFNPGTGGNGAINTITAQADGKIIIGGDFTSYNRISRYRIARLNTYGSLDSSFNPGTGANNTINTIAIQVNGKIIIGGLFSHYNGIARNGIACINPDGSLDSSFNPGTGASNNVLTTALQIDGKIIIGGEFTSFNGTDRNRIARLNADGSVDATFYVGIGANGPVYTTDVQADGKIIIGGYFTSFNGTARNRIARLNADGSLDATFNPITGANGYVYTTAVQADGKIIIGGNFTSFNGTTRNYIARLNADGSLDASFNSVISENSTVNTITMQADGKIIIGGLFSDYNGIARNRIARINADGSLDATFNPGTGPSNGVSTIAMQADSKIIIGGDFLSYNGIYKNRIVRLNADGSLDTTFNPGTGANGIVHTSAVQTDGKIIIGGRFDSYDGISRNGIARLNADGSLDASFNPGTGANGAVNTIAILAEGKIIIGGSFSFYNGTAINCIARLNADGSLDATFNPGTGTNNQVTTIAMQADRKIIIGGSFSNYNGIARNRIARINADGSLDASFNPGTGTNNVVNTIAIQADGKLIIGGIFNIYNGIARNRIARINADGSLDASFNPGTGSNGSVWTIAVQADSKIIIGGLFTSYNSTNINQIARINANGSLDASFNPGTGTNSTVRITAVQADGKIVFAGFFTNYNELSTPRIARIHGVDCPIAIPITVTGNTSFCYGESTLLTSSQLTGNLWNTGDTSRSIVVTSQGEYTVRAMNNGCTSAFSGIIRVTTLDLIITPRVSGDTYICSGNTTSLTSSFPTGNLWSTGDTTQFINVAQAGSYSVRVINSSCTSAVSAPFSVINAGPSPTVINFDTTSNRCLGARLQLTPAGTFAHYQWNTGERTRSIYTRTSGQYSVQVANSDSCFGLPSPPIFIAFDTNWCSVEIFRVGLDSITANVWADYYIWYLDGIELLSSNTLKTIPVQGDGVYTFRAVNGGRTSPLSNPIVITSAKKSINSPKLKLFPNPTSGIVTLTTSAEAESIAITNAVGQLVYTAKAQPEMELNLTNIAKGVYMVQVQSNKGVSTQRLVIQ